MKSLILVTMLGLSLFASDDVKTQDIKVLEGSNVIEIANCRDVDGKNFTEINMKDLSEKVLYNQKIDKFKEDKVHNKVDFHMQEVTHRPIVYNKGLELKIMLCQDENFEVKIKYRVISYQ